MHVVVKLNQTGETVFRQTPAFEKGNGIKSACVLHGYKPEELKEVEINNDEYKKEMEPLCTKINRNNLIRKRIKENNQNQAEQELIQEGDIDAV